MNLTDLIEYEARIRQILEGKGYKQVNLKIDSMEVSNNSCNVWLSFRGQNYELFWPTDFDPSFYSRSSITRLKGHLFDLETLVNSIPLEAAKREEKLLADFARIKERIDASNLSDRIKAETEALMKALSTNILPPVERTPEQITSLEDDEIPF